MLGDLLTADRIDLDLPSCSHAEVIGRLTGLLTGNAAVLSAEGFVAAVLEREGMAPTTMGHGLALPHARTEHVGNIVLAAGRCRAGIDFHGGGDAVHLIFLIGTPNDRVMEYLALVGGLTRRLKNAAVRDALMKVESPAEFIAALV